MKALYSGLCWLVLLLGAPGQSALSGPLQPPKKVSQLGRIIDQIGNQMDSARYDSAQYYLNIGFQLERRQPDPEIAFYLSAYQSEVFYYNALFEQGIQYALKGLHQAEALADSTMMANQHNLLGLMYTDLGQLTKAISHLQQSLRLLPTHPRSRYGLTRRYQILSNLGQCYDKIGQYDLAIASNLKSFQSATQYPSPRGSAIAAWALGNDYAALKQVHKAASWYETSLRHSLQANDYDAAIFNYPALCNVFFDERPALAQSYLKQGVQLMAAHQARISTYTKRLFAEQQSDIYFRLKNYERAVESHRLLEQIDREIASKEKQQRLAMLQAYYENERQLLRAQASERVRQDELRRNRLFTLTAGVLTGLMLLAFVAVYYGYRQKQKVKDLLQQQRISELEQKQEIAALKAMITGEERERVRIARELHDGLSGLLAAARYQVEGHFRQQATGSTLTAAPVTLIDQASQEVRRISHNLMPYALQHYGLTGALREFINNLNGTDLPQTHFEQEGPEPVLSPTAQLWLYRCVQELLTNALRHSGARQLWLAIATSPDQITIIVRDDGRGFNLHQVLEQDGNGLRNVQTRLNHLGGQVDVKSAPGRGTTIQLTVPVHETLSDL